MKIATIIVAAGRGQRAGGGIPKQYRQLGAQTVIEKTITAFREIGDIVVVIHPDDENLFKAHVSDLAGIEVVFGGATRTSSVGNGLKALLKNAPELVLIHDAARPFVSRGVIKDVISSLGTFDAVAPALPIVDAVKSVDGASLDRNKLRRVQTPQGFKYASIAKAFENLRADADFADDIAVARAAGLSIGFSKGCEQNIKLTYENDFKARQQDMITRTGIGYDVHQTEPGNSVWLCGVEVKADFSLKGHSDADVGLHAITDALLGAIAEGDIGDHFPPSDEKWRGAASDQFLAHAGKLCRDKGGLIYNVDVTIVCERPKVKPHRETMRKRIAEILDLPLTAVSVKATTTEGLGFEGRGEGISAQAVVSVGLPS